MIDNPARDSGTPAHNIDLHYISTFIILLEEYNSNFNTDISPIPFSIANDITTLYVLYCIWQRKTNVNLILRQQIRIKSSKVLV